jgi:hypothetical protein
MQILTQVNSLSNKASIDSLLQVQLVPCTENTCLAYTAQFLYSQTCLVILHMFYILDFSGYTAHALHPRFVWLY